MDGNTFDLFTLEAFRVELAGMTAENENRQRRGDAPAYSSDAFFGLENRILEYRNGR